MLCRFRNDSHMRKEARGYYDAGVSVVTTPCLVSDVLQYVEDRKRDIILKHQPEITDSGFMFDRCLNPYSRVIPRNFELGVTVGNVVDCPSGYRKRRVQRI